MDAYGGWNPVTTLQAGGGLVAQRIMMNRTFDMATALLNLCGRGQNVTVSDTVILYISRTSAVPMALGTAAGAGRIVGRHVLKEDLPIMTIIVPEVIFCPLCEGEMTSCVGVSGNTIGATLWTDGFLDAPMLQPDAHALRCPHCLKAFFRKDARSAGLDREQARASAHDAAAWVDDADLSVYRELLGKTDDRNLLRYLRISIWHLQNDKVRQAYEKIWRQRRLEKYDYPPDQRDACKAPLPKVEVRVASTRFVSNLRALLRLLTDEPDDLLMKAEICRELGRFDDAVEIARTVSDDREWAARQIMALAEAGDAQVAVLARPDEGED